MSHLLGYLSVVTASFAINRVREGARRPSAQKILALLSKNGRLELTCLSGTVVEFPGMVNPQWTHVSGDLKPDGREQLWNRFSLPRK